jgi:DNA-binding protein Fis
MGDRRFVVSVVGETSLAQVEEELLVKTLAYFRGNKTRSAAALGVDVKSVYNRLKAYGRHTVRRKTGSTESQNELS